MATTTETTEVVTEEQKVEQWRITSFTRQGFNSEQVALLLYFGVDLHDSANLIDNGCTHDVAMDILRG